MCWTWVAHINNYHNFTFQSTGLFGFDAIQVAPAATAAASSLMSVLVFVACSNEDPGETHKFLLAAAID